MAVLDNTNLRDQFPAVKRMLYLDAAHQTPLSVPVREQLDVFLDAALVSAGPKHGWLIRVEEIRAQLASFIGAATPEELAFTKNTSEGLNICANGISWEPGDNVLLVEGEHPNNAYAWLARRPNGLDVRLIPPDKKWLDADSFGPHIDSRTRAIGVSHVMFHTGQRNDLASIIQLAKRHDLEVVVDAMQSVGVLSIDVSALEASAVVAGSHKGLLTPHGLGFLHTAHGVERLSPTYVAIAGVANSRADLVAHSDPIQFHANAHRFEIGNFNLPAIHALGGALTLLQNIGVTRVEEHVLDLGDQLISCADDLGIDLIGPRERKHRSHIYVLDLTGPDWPAFLASRGVRLSTVRDGIRISFGLYNNSEDVARLGDLLRQGLESRTVRRSAGASRSRS